MNQSECEKILLDEKILEKMEAYVAGELPSEEARRVERLVREDPEALRMAGFYLRELAMLRVNKEESPGVPEAENRQATRRANGGRPEENKGVLHQRQAAVRLGRGIFRHGN